MTGAEQGFLLLTSCLGDDRAKPLTTAQFRDLTLRARDMGRPLEDRELTCRDLMRIGCDREGANRILALLSRQDQLQWYLQEGKQWGCQPVTRLSGAYPRALHQLLGAEAPGVLWAKGQLSLLELPAVSLVGSRELRRDSRLFAHRVGVEAARQGYVLVSGNATGADAVAQNACLAHGGKVISVVADALREHRLQQNLLYLAEDGYDLPFSAHRALHRNRIIHCLGQKVFVAQCRLGKGGTWNGTALNLRKLWRPVFCYADGSPAVEELLQLGAAPVVPEQLSNISGLQQRSLSFIDPQP